MERLKVCFLQLIASDSLRQQPLHSLTEYCPCFWLVWEWVTRQINNLLQSVFCVRVSR